MGMSLSGLESPYACVPAASQPPVAASATIHGLAIIGTPRQVRGPFTAPFPRGSGHSLCGQKCDVMCRCAGCGGQEAWGSQVLHVSGPVFVVPWVVRRKSLVVLALPILAQEGDRFAAGAWVGRAVLKNPIFFCQG